MDVGQRWQEVQIGHGRKLGQQRGKAVAASRKAGLSQLDRAQQYRHCLSGDPNPAQQIDVMMRLPEQPLKRRFTQPVPAYTAGAH